MKTKWLVLLPACLLSGCARYDVTLSNGNKYYDVGRPKYDEKTDCYKIPQRVGKSVSVPSHKIAVIEPHQKSKARKKSDSTDFYQ